MEKKEYTLNLNGAEWKAQFSDLADQTNGSVMLSCQDTVLLATAVMSKDGRNNPGEILRDRRNLRRAVYSSRGTTIDTGNTEFSYYRSHLASFILASY
jgi:hypothetical protein